MTTTLLALTTTHAAAAPGAADLAPLDASGALFQLACALLLAALVLPELAAYVARTLHDVRRDDTHDDRRDGRPQR